MGSNLNSNKVHWLMSSTCSTSSSNVQSLNDLFSCLWKFAGLKFYKVSFNHLNRKFKFKNSNLGCEILILKLLFKFSEIVCRIGRSSSRSSIVPSELIKAMNSYTYCWCLISAAYPIFISVDFVSSKSWKFGLCSQVRGLFMFRKFTELIECIE